MADNLAGIIWEFAVKVGRYTAVKDKNLHADITSIKIDGKLTYMCRINNKIYKMTPDEFRAKWRPYQRRTENERLF